MIVERSCTSLKSGFNVLCENKILWVKLTHDKVGKRANWTLIRVSRAIAVSSMDTQLSIVIKARWGVRTAHPR
jgi:hypothetical protein